MPTKKVTTWDDDGFDDWNFDDVHEKDKPSPEKPAQPPAMEKSKSTWQPPNPSLSQPKMPPRQKSEPFR